MRAPRVTMRAQMRALLLVVVLGCAGAAAAAESGSAAPATGSEAAEACPSGGERTDAGECPAAAADGDAADAKTSDSNPEPAPAGWLVGLWLFFRPPGQLFVGLCAHGAEGLALFFGLWGLGPPVRPVYLRERGFLLSWRIGSFSGDEAPRWAPLAALLERLRPLPGQAGLFLLGLLAYGGARRLLLGPGLGWWFGLPTFLGDVLFSTTAALLVAKVLEKSLSAEAAIGVPPLVRRQGPGKINTSFVVFINVLILLLLATAAFFVLYACLGAAQAWGTTPRPLRESPWPGMFPTLHRLVSAGASYTAVVAFRDSAQVQRALAAPGETAAGRVACVISGAGLGLQVVASLSHCIVLQAEGDTPAFISMVITLAVSSAALWIYAPLTFRLDGAGGPPPTDDPYWVLMQGPSTWFLASSMFVLPIPIALLLYRGTGWLEMCTLFGDSCRLCFVIAVVADGGRLRQSFSSGFNLETSPHGTKRPSPSVMAAVYFWLWSEAVSTIFPCLRVLGAILYSLSTRFSADCFFSLDAFTELFNGLSGPVGHVGLVTIVPSFMALVLAVLECTDGLLTSNPTFWPNAVTRRRTPPDPDDSDSTEPLLGAPWRQLDALLGPYLSNGQYGDDVDRVRLVAVAVHAGLIVALQCIVVLCLVTGADSPLDGVHNYTATHSLSAAVQPASYNRLPMLFSRTIAGAWALLIGGSLLVVVAVSSFAVLLGLQYVQVSSLYFYERPCAAVVLGFVGAGPYPTFNLICADSGGDSRNFWATVNCTALAVTVGLLWACTEYQNVPWLIIMADLLAVSVCTGSLLVSAVLRVEWDALNRGNILSIWIWLVNIETLTAVMQHCADLNVVNAKGESLLLKASVCGFDGTVEFLTQQQSKLAAPATLTAHNNHLCDIDASVDPVSGKTPLLAAVAALAVALKAAADTSDESETSSQPAGMESRLRGVIMHLSDACGSQRYPVSTDPKYAALERSEPIMTGPLQCRVDRMNRTAAAAAAGLGMCGTEKANEQQDDTALMAITRLEDIEALVCFLTRNWGASAPRLTSTPDQVPVSFVCKRVLDHRHDVTGMTSLHMALKQQWYEGACLMLRAGADRQRTTRLRGEDIDTAPLVLALRGMGVCVPSEPEPEPDGDESHPPEQEPVQQIKYAEDTVVMQVAELSRSFRRSRHDCVRSLCRSLTTRGGMALFEDLLLPIIRSYAASPEKIQQLASLEIGEDGKTVAALCYQRNCPRSLALVCRMLFEQHPHAVLRHGLLPLECTGVLPPDQPDLIQLVAVTWLRDLLINHRGDFVKPVVAELRTALAQSRLIVRTAGRDGDGITLDLDPPLQDEDDEQELDVERVRSSLSSLVTGLSKLEDGIEEELVVAMDQQFGVYTIADTTDGIDASTGLAEATRSNRRLRAEYRPGHQISTATRLLGGQVDPNAAVEPDGGSGSDDDGGSDGYDGEYNDEETIRGETARSLLESRLRIELLQLAFESGSDHEVCDSPNLLGFIARIEPSARLATLRLAYIHVAGHCVDRLVACNDYLGREATRSGRQDHAAAVASSAGFVHERAEEALDRNILLAPGVIAALREDAATTQRRGSFQWTTAHMLALLANLIAFLTELDASASPAAAAVGLAQVAAKAIFTHQAAVFADPYDMAEDVFYDAPRKSWRRWDTKTIDNIEALLLAVSSSSSCRSDLAAATQTAVAETNERLFETLEVTMGTFGSVLESGKGLPSHTRRELMAVDGTHATEIFCATEALLLCTLGTESLLGVSRENRDVIGTAIPVAKISKEPPATPLPGGESEGLTRAMTVTGAADTAAAWETPTAKPGAAAKQDEDGSDSDSSLELSRSQSERIHRSISRTSSAGFGTPTPMNAKAKAPQQEPMHCNETAAVPLGQRVRHLLLAQTALDRFLEKRTAHHHLRAGIGSLGFLQHYPACVDIAARIALASYSITRAMAVRQPEDSLRLRVRRKKVLFDSIPRVVCARPEDCREMEVEYRGEAGQDGGGLTNEWFALVGQAIGEELELDLLVKAIGATEEQRLRRGRGLDQDEFSDSDSGTDGEGSYRSGDDDDEEDAGADEEEVEEQDEDEEGEEEGIDDDAGGGEGGRRRDGGRLVTITGGRSTGASCPVSIGDLFEMRDVYGAWGAVRVLAKLDARRVLVMFEGRDEEWCVWTDLVVDKQRGLYRVASNPPIVGRHGEWDEDRFREMCEEMFEHMIEDDDATSIWRAEWWTDTDTDTDDAGGDQGQDKWKWMPSLYLYRGGSSAMEPEPATLQVRIGSLGPRFFRMQLQPEEFDVASRASINVMGATPARATRLHRWLESESEPEPEPGSESESEAEAPAQEVASPSRPVMISLFTEEGFPTSIYEFKPGAARDVVISTFGFLGRFIGLSVWRQQPIPLRLARAFLKQVQGQAVTLTDFAEANPARHRTQLEFILDNGLWSQERAEFCDGTRVDSVAELVDMLDLTGNFTVETDYEEMIELKPGGKNIKLTESNKLQFVELLAHHLMVRSVALQLKAFVAGLREFVSPAFLATWLSPKEMGVLISGPTEIDVAEWKKHTQYHGEYIEAADSQVKMWFWQYIEQDTDEAEKRQLLRFITGKSGAPPTGFRSMQPRFTVSGTSTGGDFLPVAHTCSHEIELPEYDSKEVLVEKVRMAIASTSRFDIA